jgi:glycosyltransferase involved in cell wall biosynthesis
VVPRLAIVASHPIQYQAPWFRALAGACDLEVFFCHRQDGSGQAKAGFEHGFEWDVPLLDGYAHSWLENLASAPSVDRFGGCDTPDVSDVLARGHFDACVVLGWYLKSYLQAIRACLKLNVPVLLRGDSQLAGSRGLATRIAKYVPYRYVLRRVDGHLCVGTRNREYLAYYGVDASRLFFVPHAVDDAWFSLRARNAVAEGKPDELRRVLGLSQGTPVALFVGKLVDHKRPADFVEGLASLAREARDIQGVMVGSGPLQAELERRVHDSGVHVAFAGFRNQSELPAYYALSDVLVLPSTRESWGLVVNEAMACGLPAVVSDAAGCVPDLIDERYSGLSFASGDVKGLGLAIGRMVEERNTHPAEVRMAVETKMKKYSLERAVAGTLEAIERVRMLRDKRMQRPA